jgi:hypothetical protein
MISVLPGFVKGPFKTETPFKHAIVEKLYFLHHPDMWVRIESEETEPGMPDLARLSQYSPTVLVETKVSDMRGWIKFRPDQPRWYKLHENAMKVFIIVWDKRYDRTLIMTPDEVVRRAKLSFKLPERNVITDTVYDLNLVRGW